MKKIKKSKKINYKGFSLVELLAVVVILGILAVVGISTTATLIDKAKKSETDANKNTVSIAAQTYIQNNKNLVPKVIGETVNIKISDLRSSNYLKEDIKNSKGESCMENSYVRVYKLSKTEYTYTTYLYCGNEEVPEIENVPRPIVTGKFTDSSGEVKNEKLNNVSDAYLHIEINAATQNEIQDYKNQNNQIQLDGYSFKIFVVKNGIMQEAYNSGSLSAGREEKISISKKLKNYIDVTGVTEVSLEVTAINTLGGITNTNTTVSENGETVKTDYEDTVKPKCVEPNSPYAEGDWLNKQEYNMTKEVRKLTVGCDDGTGSGCIRNYFTKSWPNDEDNYGAEFVYIEVKDNAGNISEHNNLCKFRVNTDIQTPSAEVTAYVAQASNSNDSETLKNKITGANKLKKVIKVNDNITYNNIAPTTEYYSSLVGNDTSDKWMNNENYPNGVIYKIELKDNIRLDKWTWKTNEGYISSTKDNNYKKVSENNPEGITGNVPQDVAHGMTEFHGSVKDTIYVRFLTEGMRYGVFTAYDKAGNSIQIEIAAHLDRTAPPVPNDLNAYVYNKTRTAGTTPSQAAYTFSTWTNRYVRVETASGQNRDNLTNNVTLSGFWKFYYDARNDAGKSVGSGDYSVYSSGIGYYDFKGTAAQVDGKNKIRFMGCDKANNCSSYGSYKEEWIDITLPICTVTKSITSGNESSFGWLGIGETARVTASCNDASTGTASGCQIGSLYHDYNYQINTQTAGAQGNNKAGSFTDYAGNTVDCVANQRIQIDYEKPKCTTSGGSTTWTNGNRKVIGKCSDTGGSNCQGDISFTYSSDIATNTAGPAGNNQAGGVYDKADNYISCSANQPVYVDKTKPYIEWDPKPGTYEHNTSGSSQKNISATCKDSLSGFEPKHNTYYYSSYPIPTTSSGKSFEKCCTDKAGNTYCETKTYYAKHLHEDSSCGVKKYKECRTSGCGVESYKTCRTRDCGVESYKSCKSSACGTAIDYYECRSGVNGNGGILYTCMPKCGNCPNGQWHAHYGNKTCRTAACGVESYKSCADNDCGVNKYKSCRDSACGVEEYNTCYHYRACDKLS